MTLPHSMLVICHNIQIQPISRIALSCFHMLANSWFLLTRSPPWGEAKWQT